MLLPAVVSKPKPLMVSVAALAARLAVLLVTTGVTVATCDCRCRCSSVGRDDGSQIAGGGGSRGESDGERSRRWPR